MKAETCFRLAAILGFLGVALGAFGAHGLKAVFQQYPAAGGWWEKAVLYQFVHALALLLVCRLKPFPVWPSRLFVTGVVLFSGSLYLMALTRVLWLGAVTPLGGLCFLAGWLWLAARPVPPL